MARLSTRSLPQRRVRGYNNRDMVDVPVVNNPAAVASMPSPRANEGETTGVTVAPAAGASSVLAPMSSPICASLHVVSAPPRVVPATVPTTRVLSAVIDDGGAPARRHVSALAPVREALTGIAEIGALYVNLGALAVGSPGLCGALCPFHAHRKEQTR